MNYPLVQFPHVLLGDRARFRIFGRTALFLAAKLTIAYLSMPATRKSRRYRFVRRAVPRRECKCCRKR
jgi:hypothetical protein